MQLAVAMRNKSSTEVYKVVHEEQFKDSSYRVLNIIRWLNQLQKCTVT